MPRLTVVIVSFNTRELLRRCVGALLRGLDGADEAEVWVVDNDSSDGSAAMVAAEFPGVRLIRSGANVGFARANNAALRAAGQGLGEYVLLLNPDTEVAPGAVAALAAHLDRDPSCGAVGAQLLDPDGALQRSGDAFWFAQPLRSFLRHRLPGPRPPRAVPAPVVAVDWIVGACLMLRTAALRQTGLLDESFRIYGEEIDLQWRLREAGYGVALLTGAQVLHHGGQATGQAPVRMMIEEYRTRYLLVRKHAAWPWRVLYVGKTLAELAVAVPRSPAARALLGQHLRPSFYEPAMGAFS